jgi:hypothetical protein
MDRFAGLDNTSGWAQYGESCKALTLWALSDRDSVPVAQSWIATGLFVYVHPVVKQPLLRQPCSR